LDFRGNVTRKEFSKNVEPVKRRKKEEIIRITRGQCMEFIAAGAGLVGPTLL